MNFLTCCFSSNERKNEVKYNKPLTKISVTEYKCKSKDITLSKGEVCLNDSAACRKRTKNETPKLIENSSKIYMPNEWLDNLAAPIKLKDTIPFVHPVDKGQVVKVYDGDTLTIAAKLPYDESPIYRFSVRLNGVDCPEMKSSNENEKECAQLAKKTITELVMDKVVTLRNVQSEKYGRILADVYIGDLHLNKYLIEKRLAIGYDGGTKISPTNWMTYHNNSAI